VLSAFIIALLRLQLPSDQLFYIRTQQVFGLIAVCYWYAALLISPLGYVIGKHRMKRIEFARRAIGVSAFYFVLLHGVIALWGQLGGPTELAHLPELFKWSLLAGAGAFVILAMMAATSFDKVVSFMTYRKWKWLHRLVYIGGVLAIFHIWSIGTHLAYTGVQWAAFGSLLALMGFEVYRMVRKTNDTYLKLGKAEWVTLFIASWAVVGVLIGMLPLVIQNYPSRHTEHGGSHSEAHQ
jgi:sulfoxide reductase heme-binding subunit YedZ